MDIEDLLSLKIKPLSEVIKYVAALIALLAFLIFFAVSPMHALILSGMLIIFSSMILNLKDDLRMKAFLIGCFFTGIGVLCIFIPSLRMAVLSVADGVKQQLSIIQV